MSTADRFASGGARAADSEVVQSLAAVGVVALGVVHLLVGWLALQAAWSAGAAADTSGAFATLAAQPLGAGMLWAVTIGLVALVVWQLSEAVFGHHAAGDKRTFERVKSAAKGVVYGVLAVSASSFAMGQGSSSSESQQGLTARLMNASGGQILVAAAGVAIIVIGGYVVRVGVTKKFLTDLDANTKSGATGEAVIRLGQTGHIAKGVAYVLIGILVVVAAVTHHPEESGGLDGALQTLREQPYGKWLLTAVALGLVAYGVYCFAWARALRADARR